MRRLITPLIAGLCGGAVIGAVTQVPDGTESLARAGAAIVLVTVLAPCASIVMSVARPRVLASAAQAATIALASAVTAVLVAGGGWSAAVLVPVAATLLALGVRGTLLRARCGPESAAFAGAVLPFALAASLFVADPFVEWATQDGQAQDRAHSVLRINPVAAALDLDQGVGLDWQRTRWLYDGPDDSGRGLSVVGQFYPGRSPSPWLWSGVAGLVGIVLLAWGSGRTGPLASSSELDPASDG